MSDGDIKKIGSVVGAMIAMIVILGSIAFWTAAMTWSLTTNAWERDAVKQGHAEWHLEGEVKKWRWKTFPVPNRTSADWDKVPYDKDQK